ELPLQHQARRIVCRKFGANVFAVTGGLSVFLTAWNRQPLPDRVPGVLELPGTDPAVLDWRIDIRRVGGRPSNPRETKGGVGRPRVGAGLLTVFDHSRVAQREPRLIEGIEILEDQQRDWLTEIERRLSQRTEQIASEKFRNPRADARHIL